MIKIIPSEKRHFSDFGWLQTYWLFSFSAFYDQENIRHGALRVFNDDIVQPQTGFGLHPHEEMEIVSIILEGEMVHKDTMGNETTIRTNDVQRMTAGTGLKHSEQNIGSAPVHFYQMWIYPDKRGLAPSYAQKNFTPDTWQNRLALLASNKNEENIVPLNTDGSIYRATLADDRIVTYNPASDRKIFLYVIDGGISVNGLEMKKGDQGRIDGEKSLEITTTAKGDFLLIDVPSGTEEE
ncbi:MAG: pirin family protein [Proteobacteria bacterium]|nr:pirin family protein [Pseudomonadota bacterium]MBU1138063.1 pirin family protein [Pseudomonadota bacterium]MBU1232499.1 pirin family protein [Pseudomonadota bacterium]MBU1420252.1 pirin family protein [Pseudomonadota bacterium]MBU1455581.1 pirin family protein [Pseudomonadota bacterium]